MKVLSGYGKYASVVFAALAIAMPAANGFAQEQAPATPKMASGASSLSETYDDWVLSCQGTANGTECGLMQVLSQQNGQRVLTFSISPVANNGIYAGSLIMPFGLELASGVTIALDDKAPGNPVGFKTCLPAGCIVPLEWSEEQFTALRAATNVKVTAQTSSGEPFALTVSLKGLSAAGKRAVELVAR